MLSATVGSLADAIPGDVDLPVDGACLVETLPTFNWEESGSCETAPTPTEEGLDEVREAELVLSGAVDLSELELSGPVDEFFGLACIGYAPAPEWTQETEFTAEWTWDGVAAPDMELPPDAWGDGEPVVIVCPVYVPVAVADDAGWTADGFDPGGPQDDLDDGSMRERAVFAAFSSGESVATAPRIERGAPAVQQNGDFSAAALWFGSLAGVDTDGAKLPGGKRRTR